MLAAKSYSFTSTSRPNVRRLSLASLYQQAYPALFMRQKAPISSSTISAAGTIVLDDRWTLHWSIDGPSLILNFFNHHDAQKVQLIKEYAFVIEGHRQFVPDPVVHLAGDSTLWLRLTTEDCCDFSFCLNLEQLLSASNTANASSLALNARQVQLWVPSSLGSESASHHGGLFRSHQLIDPASGSNEQLILIYRDGSVQSMSPVGSGQRRQQRGIVTVHECSEQPWKFGSSVWNLGKGLILSSLSNLATAQVSSKPLECSSKLVMVGKTGFLVTCSSGDSTIKIWNTTSQSCVHTATLSADVDVEYQGVPKLHVRLFNNGRNALLSLLAQQKEAQHTFHVFHIQFDISAQGTAKVVKLDKVAQSRIDCVESWNEAGGVHLNQISNTQFQTTIWFHEASTTQIFSSDFDIQTSKAYIKWKPILPQKPIIDQVSSLSLLRYSTASASVLSFSSSESVGFFQPVDSIPLWHGLCLHKDLNLPTGGFIAPAFLHTLSDVYNSFPTLENVVGQVCKDSNSVTLDSLLELHEYVSRVVPAHVVLAASALPLDTLKTLSDKICLFELAHNAELPPLCKQIADANAVHSIYQFTVSFIAALVLKLESTTHATKLKLVAVIKKLAAFAFPLSFYAKIDGLIPIGGSIKSELSRASDCLQYMVIMGTVPTAVVRNLPKTGIFKYVWSVYYIKSSEPVKARLTLSDLYQSMAAESDIAADVYKLLGLPLEHWNGVHFLRHITKLFSESMFFDEALHFATLARQKVETDNDMQQLTDTTTLQIELFTYAMDLHRFDVAYTSLLKLAEPKQFKVHLSHFIAQVAQHSLGSLLTKYPFSGHELDFENVLQKKAATSSWNATPNYYEIIFAYYVKRNDLKSAAFWMHMHAEAISRALDLAPFPSVIRQCQAHIVTITCLEFLPKHDQWIPTLSPMAPSAVDVGKTTITLTELRKIYLLKMSKLELKSQDKYPNLDVSVPLRPEHTLSLCSNAKMWDRAMSIADQFDLEPNLESLHQIPQ